MVWIVEKKVIHHVIGLPLERVTIPVRVRFEFEVKEGAFLPGSLSSGKLYNSAALEKRYLHLDFASLEHSLNNTVSKEIMSYLRNCGFLKEDTGS